MWYQYQAVGGSGNLVTWSYATPDPTGAHAGEAVTDVLQINCPPSDQTSGLAWSGIGITGSVVPTSVVLGAGVSGAYDAGVLTLTGRSILDLYDAGTSTLRSADVERIYFENLTVTQILPGMAIVSAAQAAIHAPVVGVTNANLASTTGGLVLPTSATFDGVVAFLSTDARVLVAFQTIPEENGIYVVSGGHLVRSTEPISVGHLIPVTTGRAWKGTIWSYAADNTFAPPPGSPTHSVMTEVAPGVTAGWVTLTTLPGVDGEYAHWYHVLVDLVASYCENVDAWTMPISRSVKLSAVYAGNPAGDMAPVGDPLAFGLPWEEDSAVRLRAVVDGSNIRIDAYRDATGGDNRTYQYRLEAIVKRWAVLA